MPKLASRQAPPESPNDQVFYPRWLNQEQAADYLGVSTRTIRNWNDRGVIRARRMPGSRLVRYDRLAIDAALGGGAA